MKKLSESSLELLRAASTSFIFKLVGMGLSYIFTYIVAKYLGSSAMGLYGLSLIFLNVLVVLGVFGLDNYIVKYVSRHKVKGSDEEIVSLYRTVISIVIPLTIILSFALYLSSGFLAESLFNDPELGIYLKYTSVIVIPFCFLRINYSVFMGLKQIKILSLFENVLIYLFSIIIILFFLLFNEFETPVTIIAYMISVVITSVISFIYLKKEIGLNKVKTKTKRVVNIIRESLPMLLTSSTGLIVAWTDIFMLGIFSTSSNVGIYRVVVKIASLISLALLASNTISAPKFSEESVKDNGIGLKPLVRRNSVLLTTSGLAIFIVIFSFSKEILMIFGEEYIVGKLMLQILTIGYLSRVLTGSIGAMFQNTGRHVLQMKLVIFYAILNIILNLVFIPKYGMLGAAIGTTSTIVTGRIISSYFFYKEYGFYPFLTLKRRGVK